MAERIFDSPSGERELVKYLKFRLLEEKTDELSMKMAQAETKRCSGVKSAFLTS